MQERRRECPPPENIRWSTQGAVSRRQGWRRWSPKPLEKKKWWVVSSKLALPETHYWGGFTLPCMEPRESCPACISGHESRPYGYLVCVSWPNWVQPNIVELTTYAVNGCPQLTSETHGLRGSIFEVERMGKFSNSPVACRLTGWKEIPSNWPDPDVVAALRKMWNGGFRRLGNNSAFSTDDRTAAEGTTDAL